MANKATKKDNFNILLTFDEVKANEEIVAFIKHEIELLDRKAENRSTKPTVRQAENAEIKAEILSKLAPMTRYRCSEIQAMIPALAEGVGTQRTARLCTDLAEEGKLIRVVDKRVVYFALAE